MATSFKESKSTIEHKKEIIVFAGGLGGYARIVSELPPEIDREGNKICVFVLSVNDLIKKRYFSLIINNQCDVNGRFMLNKEEKDVVYVKMKYPEVFCPPKSFNFTFDTVFRLCFTGFNNEDDIYTWYARSLAIENKMLLDRLDYMNNMVNVLLEDNTNLIELRSELARKENRFIKLLKHKTTDEAEKDENRKLEGEVVD